MASPTSAFIANPQCVNCGRYGFAHGTMIADRAGNAFCSPDCGWSFLLRAGDTYSVQTTEQEPAYPALPYEETPSLPQPTTTACLAPSVVTDHHVSRVDNITTAAPAISASSSPQRIPCQDPASATSTITASPQTGPRVAPVPEHRAAARGRIICEPPVAVTESVSAPAVCGSCVALGSSTAIPAPKRRASGRKPPVVPVQHTVGPHTYHAMFDFHSAHSQFEL